MDDLTKMFHQFCFKICLVYTLTKNPTIVLLNFTFNYVHLKLSITWLFSLEYYVCFRIIKFNIKKPLIGKTYKININRDLPKM